jgi:hypothetical protein
MGKRTPGNIGTTNGGYEFQFERELLGGMVFVDIRESDVLHLDKIQELFVGDPGYPLLTVGEFQKFD